MLGKSLKVLDGIAGEHSDNKRAKDAADFVRAELAKLEKCLSVESDDYLLWIVL